MNSDNIILDRAWYLVYTKPRQEAVAELNLLRQEYEVYFPRVELRKRLRHEYKTVVEPLFSRYLFIALNQETDNWGPIRSTIGVSDLVRFGGVPARVPDALIHLLKEQTQQHGYDKILMPEFKAGEKVRILEGALAGYEAIFEAKTSQQRVKVLLDIVGQKTRVMLSADAIAKIG